MLICRDILNASSYSSEFSMLRNSNQPVTGTILVADDQASNRELLEELLTAEGFKVASVSNGAAALEQLSVMPVDLVRPAKTSRPTPTPI
jgi:PleD family two-component response regulator